MSWLEVAVDDARFVEELISGDYESSVLTSADGEEGDGKGGKSNRFRHKHIPHKRRNPFPVNGDRLSHILKNHHKHIPHPIRLTHTHLEQSRYHGSLQRLKMRPVERHLVRDGIHGRAEVVLVGLTRRGERFEIHEFDHDVVRVEVGGEGVG